MSGVPAVAATPNESVCDVCGVEATHGWRDRRDGETGCIVHDGHGRAVYDYARSCIEHYDQLSETYVRSWAIGNYEKQLRQRQHQATAARYGPAGNGV